MREDEWRACLAELETMDADYLVGSGSLLAQGRSPQDAFALAVATGTATVLTMGTELCRREDVERFYREIAAQQVASGDGRHG